MKGVCGGLDACSLVRLSNCRFAGLLLVVAIVNISDMLHVHILVNLQSANVILRAGPGVPPVYGYSSLNLRRRIRWLHALDDKYLLMQGLLPGSSSILTQLGQARCQSNVELTRALNTLLITKPCDILVELDDVGVAREPTPPSSDRSAQVAENPEAAPEIAE